MILASLFVVILTLLMTVGVYVFCAYVMYRIGDKFRIGTFRAYLIPVYSLMLICDCAKVTRWVVAGVIIPGAIASICSSYCGGYSYVSNVGLISAVCWVYLWGSVADKLGKNFWLWGLLCLFFGGIPTLFLAFDSSMPREQLP